MLQTTLTDYERPSRIAFQSEGSRADITGRFTLQPEGDGVEVKLAADVQPRGLLLSLLAPLLAVAFRRQNAAAAARLQAVLER